MPRGSRRHRVTIQIPCTHQGCPQTFRSESGRTNHVRTCHPKHDGHRLHQHINPNARSLPNHSTSSTPSPPPQFLSDSPIQNRNHSISSTPSPPPRFPSEAPIQQRQYPEEKLSKLKRTYHPFLNGRPCDENGAFLRKGSHLPPRTERAQDDWSPFEDKLQFKVADFLFQREEMSRRNINHLLELWALSLMEHGGVSPFDHCSHLHEIIDAIQQGDAPWKCFKTAVDDVGDDAPNWKRKEYDVWYRDPEVVARNMLANPDFDTEFDTTPYVEVDKDDNRRWSDFMSANYAWRHCDMIYEENPAGNDGAMYVPIILSSDKTTVTVGTGAIEYHPLYFSIGNVHNSVRRAHRNAVVPIGFLAIPKDDRKYDNNPAFRLFKRQLYHSSISAILSSLNPAMTTPAVYQCPDGHFRRVIFDLGPFIADYPEQVMLAGVLQNWCPHCTSLPDDIDGAAGPRTNMLNDTLLAGFSDEVLRNEYGIDAHVVPFTRDFPRADIHELLSSDLLHQAIKGTFKDHLVTWVGEYLFIVHEPGEANHIMDEIDRRLAAVPVFSDLRRFKHGRRFKQWTGDDSKALMKIFLPAIHGLVPAEIVKCVSAFLDFCYIARRSDFDMASLKELDNSLRRFHINREIFRTTGVREGFSLPRQHSLVHYKMNIQDFSAPNGLCSSITESRHITAVKKPWRRSNRYEALGQMLLINQHLDKIIAARIDFISRGMLPSERPTVTINDDDDDGGPIDEKVLADVQLARTRVGKYPSDAFSLAEYISEPSLPTLIHNFICQQLDIKDPSDFDSDSDADVSDNIFDLISPISVFHSAVATFFAPSDVSGIRGMRRERIHSTPSWRAAGARQDCVFVVEDQNKPGFLGMSVVRVKLLFSFAYEGEEYPCALVEWFKKVGRSADEQTGMWIVKPEMDDHGERLITVVHLDTILRSAHLLPVYGKQFLPPRFHHTWSLDTFQAFFVNKYADHHANEIVF